MSKLFDQLLSQRGFTSDFLYPEYSALTDPFVFPGMDRAVSRIQKAVKGHEKILIHGDYDVDGVTASTALYDTLKLAGVRPENLEIMLPNRFTDGYGMSPRLVARAREQGITLVITVDCGSRNHEIIEELRDLKIDTIVTDHHECDSTFPSAVAILNPKRPDFPKEYQYLRNLAGVGVVFKLAEALRDRGLLPAGQEKWLLDLVLLGTICDAMPLTGENRILCFYGLKVIEKTRRPGLRELIRRAKVREFTSDSIGFQLGPRLNAAGRLRSPDLSLQLLTTTSRTEAASLAEELEQLNHERRQAQDRATSEITTRGLSEDPVIIEVGPWHEGIIGIVAGRLVEQYHRPAFVFTEIELKTPANTISSVTDDQTPPTSSAKTPNHATSSVSPPTSDPTSSAAILKGSARSFGDFSLAAALDHVRPHLIKGGGHAAAAGLSLAPDNLENFRAAINDFYRSLHLGPQDHFWRTTADLTLTDLAPLTLDLLAELAALEPYGEGNQKPIFRLGDIHIQNAIRLGANRQHLRLDLADREGHRLKAIAFSAPTHWLELTPDDHIAPLVTLEENTYQGITSVEARLINIDFLD